MQVGLIADAEIPISDKYQQSIACRMSRVPAVWRYAGRAVGADRDMLVSLPLASSVGTYLYGRRMYETMVYWETAHTIPDQPQFVLE
jgi:hypothetical protein